MRKIRISLQFIIALFFGINLISCGGIGKTTMDELSFTKGNRNEMCVTKGSSVYCGDFWSNDGKTIKMSTNNYGIIQSVSYFHPNGKLAFYIPLGSDGYFDDEARRFYDENGNKIEKREWKRLYDSYFDAMCERFIPDELKDW